MNLSNKYFHMLIGFIKIEIGDLKSNIYRSCAEYSGLAH